MNKGKILVIQPNFDSDFPRNIRSSNIFKWLKSDYDIFVLSLKNDNQQRNIEGIQIQRIELSWFSKYIFLKDLSGFKPKGMVKFFSRSSNYILSKFTFPDSFNFEHHKFLSKALALIEEERIKFVVFSIYPHSNYSLAIKLSKILGSTIKIIFDIGDPLYLNSADNNHFLRRLRTKSFEKKAMKVVDGLILTNNQTKKMYQDNKIIPDSTKVSIIPQGCNIKIFNQFEKHFINLKFQKLKLIYAGALYKGLRNPKPLIEAIKEIDRDKIQLEMYGAMQDLNIDSKNISFFPRLPQSELITKYHSNNILVHFDNAFGVQSSGKIFELLAIKKPILFIYESKNSISKKEFEHFSTIFFVQNKKEEIVKKLNEFLSMNKTISINYSIDQFSWKDRADKFDKLLSSVE